MYPLVLTLLLCWLALPVLAQQSLARARQRSYLTKIFRLTDPQARRLFARGLEAARPDFFAVPVDSLPTDSADTDWARRRPLPPGYYLVTHTEGPELVYWLRAETGRTVEVLDNQRDLVLVVRDSAGRLVPDARVRLRRRAVPFDPATRTYRLANAGRPGLVAVTQGGRTTYQPLAYWGWGDHSDYRPAWWRRAGNRVLYGFPLGYLGRPVRRTVHDLAHAAYADGGLVGLLRSPFSEDVRQTRHQRRARRWRGYVVLSQPRYRPGDTLRLKARVLRQGSGRPCRRPLALVLRAQSYGAGRDKRLAVLRPTRPGTYEYTLVLADTLGLRPDTEPWLALEDGHEAELMGRSFRYEDYELRNASYALRLLEPTSRRGQTQAALLRGTDANGLNLLDARVRLVVRPAGPPGPLPPGGRVFVPDTLWTHAQALDPLGETRLDLPARIFPDADLRYAVQATLLTSDNERRVEEKTAAYRRDPGQLRLELRADSLRLSYDSLGHPAPHRAWLRPLGPGPGADDDEDVAGAAGPAPGQPVTLPLTLPLDPLQAGYELRDAAGRTAELRLTPANAELTAQAVRTADSVQLEVSNPHRVPFWYFVYRGQRLRYRGYGTRYQLAVRDQSAAPWHLSLHYRWGADMRADDYVAAPPARRLVLRAEQPAAAYPGQRLHLRFQATDERGHPVAGADLAAYAYTSKFGRAVAPALPALRRQPVMGRRSRRRFRLAAGPVEAADEPGRQPLDWAHWRRQLGLDSLQFYKFLYPASGQFLEFQPAPDSLTQVAPFVVEKGVVQAPLAVYLDGRPLWLGALADSQPYALVADPGLHALSWRLPDRLVTLHDVYLPAGRKLTLSVDPAVACRELTVVARPRQLLPGEELTLRRTVLAVAGESNSLGLRQGPAYYRLGEPGYGGLRLAGPLRPDLVQVLRPGGWGWSPPNLVFEPLYEYSFPPGVVKLRCLEPGRLGPLNRPFLARPLPLGDFALTGNFLALRPQPETFRWVTLPTANDAAGLGRLELRLPAPTDPRRAPRPVYALLTRPGEPGFARLAHGGELLRGLAPGRYQVAVLLSDTTALAPAAPVLVAADGTTYLQLAPADRQPGLPLLRRLEPLLAQLGGPGAGPVRTPAPAPTGWQPEYHPDWRTLTGRVTDKRGQGLPGVTVLVKGTTYGISTNAEGYYSLQVPPATQELTFSSVGYKQQVLAIGAYPVLNAALVEDAGRLGEVVVVGYGVQRRADLTGSVATVSALQGRTAGVQVVTGPGGRVLIRGASSAAGSPAPLILVNGLPFEGDISGWKPEDIAELKTLDGAQATAIYGSQAAGGVVLITTRPGARPAGLAAALLPGADPRLSLRRRFRDYAWWQPTLLTDAQGRAQAEVTLPDDVTGWDTFVVGSDNRGRLGTATGRLRAFKALRAELAAPRFLVAGDRAQVLGKVLNYQGDTARVTATFRQGGRVLRERTARVASSLLDTLTLTAPAYDPAAPAPDSLEITFGLTQPNGFADGEQHRLPVLPAGTRETVGTFAALLAPDTTVAFRLDPRLGPATLHVERDALPVLLAEINHLEQYAYLCNEQLASRLQGLLLEAQIRRVQGQPFRRARSIRFLVRRLLAGRQGGSGLWGTWAAAEVSPWATLHVVEALVAAQQAGYPADFNREAVTRYLLAELDAGLAEPVPTPPRVARPAPRYFLGPDDQLRLLHLLRTLDAPLDYAPYVRRLEARLTTAPARRPALDQYLALTELRQRLGLAYQLDSLRRFRHRSELGGAYYADTLRPATYFRYLLPDRVGITLLAYRVLRRQGGHAAELARLRAWLLEQRRGGYWPSTYQAAQLLATIGPDLLTPAGPPATGTITLSGQPGLPAGPQQQFPLTLTLPAPGAAPLLLHKAGGLPLYATATQARWLPRPEAAARPFTVTTTLAGQGSGRVSLPAGRPAELLVTVDVPAEARYVLLEVPVPAGCSYGDPARPSGVEVHREYLRQQAGIFIDYLPAGRHTFRVNVQPRYRGTYTLNPARAELLYFPTKMGRTAGKQVVIR